ncbi:hypothetical protein CVR98_26445 [Salmonella enterica subsp. enterica serovar Enteritidis]|nr:hypothetical protein CVR98_26445 [Salmonella enterica subsp. enterica serovar Enteritidis]
MFLKTLDKLSVDGLDLVEILGLGQLPLQLHHLLLLVVQEQEYQQVKALKEAPKVEVLYLKPQVNLD